MNQTFDEQPVPELNSDALDFRAASDSFAPVRKLRETFVELDLDQGLLAVLKISWVL